jgi:hypothetical protein
MHASRWVRLTILGSTIVAACGCSKPAPVAIQEKPSTLNLEPHSQGSYPEPVLFDLKPSATSSGVSGLQSYECSYHAEGEIAQFRIEFRQDGALSGKPIPMAFGEGRFLAVAGSKNSALLSALQKALQAKRVPTKSHRVSELQFTVVILGDKMSRNADGSYSDQPPGNWIPIKITLPKDGDDGEVFLNLNPSEGKGEFAIKDSDYGDYLLKQFAKVL